MRQDYEHQQFCFQFWFMMKTTKIMFVSVHEFEDLDNLDAVKISSRPQRRQKAITAKQVQILGRESRNLVYVI